MNSNQYSEARGGAISIAHSHDEDNVTIINRCRFIDNEIHSMNRAVGSAISVLMGQADITNNLIINNRAISYDPGDGYTQGSIYYEGPYYFDQEQGNVKGDVERRYIANNNIIFKSFSLLPSNLKTKFGEVLDALIRPHPFLKFILNPSIEILSPLISHSSVNFLIIWNFVSSVTLIFNSGVEYDFGKSSIILERFLEELDIISTILAPA